VCWKCKLDAIREREKMKLIFSTEVLEFLASFKKEMNTKDICYRIGLVNSVLWLACEDKDNITSSDVLVACYKDEVKVWCDTGDLDVLRGTTVDYELHGLSKRICFKDPRFGRVLFAGDPHPALIGEKDD